MKTTSGIFFVLCQLAIPFHPLAAEEDPAPTPNPGGEIVFHAGANDIFAGQTA